MNTLTGVLQPYGSVSLRDVVGRFSETTLRGLMKAQSSTDRYTYLGYLVVRSGNDSLRITNEIGEFTDINLQNAPLTEEQKKQILDKAWEKFKEIFTQNSESVLKGEMKAADLGGLLYGGVASAILLVINPFKDLGGIGKAISGPFVALAANRGRYYGAAVDELVAFLKGESELEQKEIVGILASTAVVATYFGPVGALIPLGGTTAWDLTIGVGKWVGGALGDAVDELRKVPGLGDLINAAEDVVEFVGKIF